MLNTIRAIVKEGKIELLEKVHLPNGAEVLVTVLPGETQFWIEASQTSLDSVWGERRGRRLCQLTPRVTLSLFDTLSPIFQAQRFAPLL